MMQHGLFAVMGALLIVVAYAAFLAVEFVMAHAANRGEPTPPASLGEWARAWWREIWLAPRVFLWRLPFRSAAIPDSLPSLPRRRGVLLVHGFVCNRGLWNPWMKRLRDQGSPFVAVNLAPVFGSIDRYAPIIESAVRRLELATGLPPLIVAHSMGGLAVRDWLTRTGSSTRVEQVITFGTPHAGTALARFAFSLNGKQMRRDGEWFRDLLRRESSRERPRFVCFYSRCDNVVFPASTATLAGADNRHVPGCAHLDLLFQPVVFNEVLRALAGSDGDIAC